MSNPTLEVVTLNGDGMQLEIEENDTLSATIHGKVVGNTHVELAAYGTEHDGLNGIMLTDNAITFNRSCVWLADSALDPIAKFLTKHRFPFTDARQRQVPMQGRP